MSTIEFKPDVDVRCSDYSIGCIGSGFIMADIHLAAYDKAGFNVAAIASRTRSNAQTVADRWGIKTVHDSPEDLIRDESIEIIDIAYPPHLQGDLIALAAEQPHIKAILAQKPLATTYAGAREIVDLCESRGKTLSINQNMRYDQSMRVLRQILDAGMLGTPVMASIDMRAIPHWQAFLDDYDRLTLLNMSVHHLDIMRYQFGEVSDIYVAARPDPRRASAGFSNRDGICISSLSFESGVSGVCIDDVWASPVREGFDSDLYIAWRVEGEKGVAKGTIGWPDYPDGSPSTLAYVCDDSDGKWVYPKWDTMWFPDGFIGVMEQLQYAVKNNEEPFLNGRDNLKTMALVEAGYRSIDEKRAVSPAEIESES